MIIIKNEKIILITSLSTEINVINILNISQINSKRKINVSNVYNLNIYQMKSTFYTKKSLN